VLSVLQILIDVTKQQGSDFHDRGTIVVIEGPRFSTKAESYMFQSFGASLVGMTSVPEVTYDFFSIFLGVIYFNYHSVSANKRVHMIPVSRVQLHTHKMVLYLLKAKCS